MLNSTQCRGARWVLVLLLVVAVIAPAATVRDPLDSLHGRSVDSICGSPSWSPCDYLWYPSSSGSGNAFAWDSVNFGAVGVDYVSYRYGLAAPAGQLTGYLVDFRLDGLDGTVYATIELRGSGDWCTFRTDFVAVAVRPTGIRSVWLCPRSISGTSVAVTHFPNPTPPTFTRQPTSVSANDGGNAIFIAKAGGFPRPTYQWIKGTTPVLAAQDTLLDLYGVTAASADSYRLIATNSAGCDTSDPATLTVIPVLPTVSHTPNKDSTIVLYGSMTYRAVVSGGTSPFTYQWKKNNVSLVRTGTKTDSSYLVLSNLAITDSGNYSVTVSNGAGSAFSTATHLSVRAVLPRAVVSPSGNVARIPGDTITLRGTVTQGSAPFAYQWYHNGTPMTGRTRDTLKLGPLVFPADTGMYKVAVANIAGFGYDSMRLVVQVLLPQVTVLPRKDTLAVGSTTVFRVVDNGANRPLAYEWYRVGVVGKLSDADSVLNLANIQLADDNSNYYAVVSNIVGSDTTELCTLRVVQPVVSRISSSPRPAGGFAPFIVTFLDSSIGSIASWSWNFGDGSPVRTYTARRDTVQHTYTIVGQHYARLTVLGVPPADQSSTGQLVIVSGQGPDVFVTPTCDTVSPGGSAVFHAMSSSAPITSYTWRRVGGGIVGSSDSLLVLNNVQLTNDNTMFFVIAGNAGGTDTSEICTLRVMSNAGIAATRSAGAAVNLVEYTLYNIRGQRIGVMMKEPGKARRNVGGVGERDVQGVAIVTRSEQRKKAMKPVRIVQ